MDAADTVLMVRPAAFGADPEAARTNAFMRAPEAGVPEAELLTRAQAEFDALVDALRSAGVRVLVLDDTPEPATPDAVFPNNWFSTDRTIGGEHGILVLYPMCPPARRLERRPSDLAALFEREGFRVSRTIDRSFAEEAGRYLEGTGSLVLDHTRRFAYACRSARTDEQVLTDWCAGCSYGAFVFDAVDDAGDPIYHTNVMLSLGERFAVVCFECMPDGQQRADLRDDLVRSGRTLIDITSSQMGKFCANVLELQSQDGERLLAMSRTAHTAFTSDQLRSIERFTRPVVADIPTIESVGGGSVRCMIAEVFLPPIDGDAKQ